MRRVVVVGVVGLSTVIGTTLPTTSTAAARVEPAVIHGDRPDQPNPHVGRLVVLEDGLAYYTANAPGFGGEPWVTDGTRAGTRMVADVVPGPGGSAIEPVAVLDGSLVFTRDDDDHGRELWITDGTASGTTLLRDIYPGARGSSPSDPFVHDGLLYFAATDSLRNPEPWVTDGTPGGTRLLKEISTAAETGSTPSGFGLIGGRVFFAAGSPAHGYEMWTTDGTSDGTTMVVDANPGPESSVVADLTYADDQVFYRGTRDDQDGDGEPDQSGYELWRSDGTAAGTRPVKDILRGPPTSFVSGLTPVGDRVVFSARSNGDAAEPWISDGTADGTHRLADLRPGSEGSRPHSFTVIGAGTARRVLFAAHTGSTMVGGLPANELWVSDLTEAGTRALRDVPGLTQVGEPISWSTWRGRAMFEAKTSTQRLAHWVSDGTVAGTRPLTRADDWHGGTVVRDSLVWTAEVDEPGSSTTILWALPLSEDNAGRQQSGTVASPTRPSTTAVSLRGRHGSARVRVAVTAAGATPHGTVRLAIDGRAFRDVRLTGGRVDLAAPTWARPGAHTVTATYRGSTGVRASQATARGVVGRRVATLSVSRRPGRAFTILVVRVGAGGLDRAARIAVIRRGDVVARGRSDRRGLVRLRVPRSTRASVVQVRWAGTSEVTASTVRVKVPARQR